MGSIGDERRAVPERDDLRAQLREPLDRPATVVGLGLIDLRRREHAGAQPRRHPEQRITGDQYPVAFAPQRVMPRRMTASVDGDEAGAHLLAVAQGDGAQRAVPHDRALNRIQRLAETDRRRDAGGEIGQIGGSAEHLGAVIG